MLEPTVVAAAFISVVALIGLAVHVSAIMAARDARKLLLQESRRHEAETAALLTAAAARDVKVDAILTKVTDIQMLLQVTAAALVQKRDSASAVAATGAAVSEEKMRGLEEMVAHMIEERKATALASAASDRKVSEAFHTPAPEGVERPVAHRPPSGDIPRVEAPVTVVLPGQ